MTLLNFAKTYKLRITVRQFTQLSYNVNCRFVGTDRSYTYTHFVDPASTIWISIMCLSPKPDKLEILKYLQERRSDPEIRKFLDDTFYTFDACSYL